MKKRVVFFLTLVSLSVPALAFDGFPKKLNVDCLKGTTNFTMKDEDGNYRDEPLYNITLSLRENGKYLILQSEGPHIIWPVHSITLKLTRHKDHYIEKLINLKVTPFCNNDELFLDYVGKPYMGRLFKKVNY
ncbi:MAG: hypothetical protein A2X86_08275 [Bdellovibrionales bacterium GWA2_49_15]|nr:MAG: hypothetical protein A2X86_08275 [Bdellovibrionales bacterium GWA2_49_15]HAZ11243.1 hypothetical protein [Bdellovibrionales bacterium]